jgi:vacuolar-type H+-ATPase subunit E/Vma4
MAPQSQTSSQLLCAEILAQAQRESDEIVRRAQQQAESVLANAAAQADKLFQQQLAKARTEAARQVGLILATVPIEAQRVRASRTEALLESIHETVRQRLLARERFDYRRALTVMAAEALCQVGGEVFMLKLSPADYLHFADGLAQDIARHIEHSKLKLNIAEDPKVTGGGLIVHDPEGHYLVDNRLPMRLERLWPELRRQIAVQTDLINNACLPEEAHDCSTRSDYPCGHAY